MTLGKKGWTEVAPSGTIQKFAPPGAVQCQDVLGTQWEGKLSSSSFG